MYPGSAPDGFGRTIDRIGGVGNFGFKLEILNNYSVGFDTPFSTLADVETNLPAATTGLFTGLRLTYNFIPRIGVAIGVGVSSPPARGNESTATLGFFGNLSQNFSVSGIITGLKIRADFVAPLSSLEQSKAVFALVFNLGFRGTLLTHRITP
ncbi:MAG: hypothetical protein LBP20_09025 [Treponema sp.]|nr:hypothetical protein [Treponema sp.]